MAQMAQMAAATLVPINTMNPGDRCVQTAGNSFNGTTAAWPDSGRFHLNYDQLDGLWKPTCREEKEIRFLETLAMCAMGGDDIGCLKLSNLLRACLSVQ